MDIYYDRQKMIDFINELLKEYDLDIGDLNAIIGTPDLDTQEDYSNSSEHQDITYHSISHLFSAIARIRYNLQEGSLIFNGFDERFSEKDNKISMVMKVIQEVSNQIIEKTIQNIIKEFGVDSKNTYLAMGGGYTLNCVSNGVMMRKFGFKGFMAPPCVNDGGQSFGNALYYFYCNMDKFNFRQDSSYYGDSDKELEKVLEDSIFSKFIKKVEEFNLEQVVKDIEDDVIVWFDGRAEIGPRTLGARSLLGDPRKTKVKDRLNEIKHRQWWRPVAPIILETDMSNWFKDGYSSPFMLHTFYIKDDKLDMVPAIAHLDNSARVQTLNKKTNQNYLYQWYKSYARKFRTIPRTGALVRKLKKYYQFDEEEKNTLMKECNPYSVTLDDLQIYYYTSELREQLDLTKSFDVKMLAKAKKMYANRSFMITE